MARKTGSAIIKDENDIDDLDVERKDQYLKRIKAEDKANKKNYATKKEWIDVEGGKVLKRRMNASGSLYTFYLFNARKQPELFAELKKKGGLVEFVKDKEVLVPLKTIEHKPFKGK